MVNTLRDIGRWAYGWILAFFGTVDTALAYWEKEFIKYASEAKKQSEVRAFHRPSECKHPDVCPYYGHDARDEYEQAVHG